MKIKLRATVLAVLVITAAVMAAGAVKGVAQMSDESENTQKADFTAFSGDSGDAEYYLRDCSGYVAVFKGARSTTPIEITSIETETLNNVDRKLLADGIPAEDKNELLMLLEDFSS